MGTSQFKVWRCDSGHVHLRVAKAPGLPIETYHIGVDFLDMDTFVIFMRIMDNFRDTYCKPPVEIPDAILKAFGEKTEGSG